MKSSKSPSDNNNQINILNGQKVSITTDLTVDNNDSKSESVQVKSVNYKELIKQSPADDRETNDKNVRSLLETLLFEYPHCYLFEGCIILWSSNHHLTFMKEKFQSQKMNVMMLLKIKLFPSTVRMRRLHHLIRKRSCQDVVVQVEYVLQEDVQQIF